MAADTIKRAESPRVFISYARSDGEAFATDLRKRLLAKHIPLWQDRVGMEGGRGWWQQITEALDQVEFMVLVMTPAAMQSPTVRKEWRYARQQGVCVYPVMGIPNLDFASLPHWMHKAHFYDLSHEWTKFVNDLNTRCEQVRVPFMVEDLPADFVPRPHEFEALIDKVLDERREEPIAITAALRGAGGYGKTTMAKALCHDEHIQQAFDDGILWVTLGENPGNLVGKVEDLIYTLNHERPGFTGIDAATARLAELLADRAMLLVIDDVWNATHLKPFLQGGKRCARLITTRNEDTLPVHTQSIQVDAMQQKEAVQLLTAGLEGSAFSASDRLSLEKLAAHLGEWPLLLKLANGRLRKQMGRGQLLSVALEYLNKALDKHGLAAFDADNPLERDQAVRATLGASLELLDVNESARYQEMAVFPEDVDVPLETVYMLWAATGGLDAFDTEELCQRLSDLSLLLRFDSLNRTIRVHDVIRGYLQHEVGPQLPALHAQLLDAYSCNRWAELPQDEPYLWDHLADHLIGAQLSGELNATVKDLRYLASKTLARSAYAVETDLAVAEQFVPEDVPLRLLKRHFVTMEHLLTRCTILNDVTNALSCRLQHLPELSDLCQRSFAERLPPFVGLWHPLPDLPHSALIRTLQGHAKRVIACAVSPDGTWIVSASVDNTLKVWDAHTGEVLLTLQGHTSWVYGCAVSPDGTWIVSASLDNTLKVWDAHTGEVRLTLQGHTDGVIGCAVSPDGTWVVSASLDNTLKVWDAGSGAVRLTLQEHTDRVTGCAVSPDGTWVVSASLDNTLKVWDAHTGEVHLTLQGHTDGVTACAVSPDGTWIVSASLDNTLKVWDAHTGEVRLTLQGHTSWVYGCAVSPDGAFIVSASLDNTLKVWDAGSGAVHLMLQGHTERMSGCAVSPDGAFIVSASLDNTLKVWDAGSGEVRLTLQGHTDRVIGCAVSPDGTWIVSASLDNTLKVWDAHTGEVRLTLQGHTSWVTACAVSPDGAFIVSASLDNTLKVWDTGSGAVHLTLQRHTDRVYGCAVSPDGTWIVSASGDNTLKVWDAGSGAVRLTLQGHTDRVTGCAVSPDGTWVVSVSGDNTLKVWDAHTGEVCLTLQGHTDRVYGCAVSPDSTWVVSVSGDNTLKVWHIRTGICLITFPVEGALRACTFHPDGRHLVATGAGGVYFLEWVP
jgi:WD40 repeat protein